MNARVYRDDILSTLRLGGRTMEYVCFTQYLFNCASPATLTASTQCSSV